MKELSETQQLLGGYEALDVILDLLKDKHPEAYSFLLWFSINGFSDELKRKIKGVKDEKLQAV